MGGKNGNRSDHHTHSQYFKPYPQKELETGAVATNTTASSLSVSSTNRIKRGVGRPKKEGPVHITEIPEVVGTISKRNLNTESEISTEAEGMLTKEQYAALKKQRA